MKHIQVVSALALLVVAPVYANYGRENPRLERLYGTFISPCCWRENLTVHESQIAHELRGRIQKMVRDGQTDEEIKAVFVKEYTKQILALPEGPERVWLFWTPWMLAGIGLLGVSFAIKRLGNRTPSSLAYSSMPPAEFDDD